MVGQVTRWNVLENISFDVSDEPMRSMPAELIFNLSGNGFHRFAEKIGQ